MQRIVFLLLHTPFKGGVFMRRSNDLSNEELELIQPNEELTCDESIKLFLEDCKIRNLRDETVKYYYYELKAYVHLMRDSGVEPAPQNVTSGDIKTHVIVQMRDLGRKTVTVNTRLRAIRSYFNFLVSEGYIKESPMQKISLLRTRRHVVETFSKKQLEDLFKSCDMRTLTGYRDYCIMVTLLDTGIRVSECVGLKISDLNFQDSYIRIQKAKTHMERLVPLQDELAQILKRYIQIRGLADTEALFLTIDGTPITRRQIQNRITHYGKMANIQSVRCSAHTFRHTFAKMSVESGAGVFELQQILGHTSMEMVRHYVNLFAEDVTDKHKAFSPLSQMHK